MTTRQNYATFEVNNVSTRKHKIVAVKTSLKELLLLLKLMLAGNLWIAKRPERRNPVRFNAITAAEVPVIRTLGILSGSDLGTLLTSKAPPESCMIAVVGFSSGGFAFLWFPASLYLFASPWAVAYMVRVQPQPAFDAAPVTKIARVVVKATVPPSLSTPPLTVAISNIQTI